MLRNYRVYTQHAQGAPWKDTGIIESDKATALCVWESIKRRLKLHAFKLEPITYGVAIDRSVQ